MVAFDMVSYCLLVDFHPVIAMRHNGPDSVTFSEMKHSWDLKVWETEAD